MAFQPSLVALLLGAVAAGGAAAQSPAPAAAPASKSNCTKPGDHPGRLSSDNQRRGWNKELNGWQECMKKYVTEVQGRADVAVKAANAAVAESNAAVNEYNAAVKEIQAQIDANTK